MTEPDAPSAGSFLHRWKETEPLRLYLYGITVPLLGAALAYGWVTTEQLGAWLAVAGALFIGSTVAGELARRQVTPVDGPVLNHWLEQQHQLSWEQGVEDARQAELAAQDEPGAHAAPEPAPTPAPAPEPEPEPEPVAFGENFHRASDAPGMDLWRQRVPEPELWRQEAPGRRRASDPPETETYAVVRQRCTEVEHGRRCLLERHGDGVPHLFS